jgi:hypothetical protein
MKNSIRLLLVVLSLLCFTALSFSQEAGGGRVPAPPKKPSDAKTAKAPVTPKRPTTLDRIDGKWWTTGNDFGPSEVELTQNGSNILRGDPAGPTVATAPSTEHSSANDFITLGPTRRAMVVLAGSN